MDGKQQIPKLVAERRMVSLKNQSKWIDMFKFELDCDGKQEDRWNVYDPAPYERLRHRCEARDEARRSKKLELEKNTNNQNKQGGGVSDDEKQ